MTRRKSKSPSAVSTSVDRSILTGQQDNSGLSNTMLKQLRSPPSPYEVRCYECDTSFAPGRKKCVHCGLRLSRPNPISGIQPDYTENSELAEEDVRVRSGTGRNLMWVITAVAMLFGSAMRACQ